MSAFSPILNRLTLPAPVASPTTNPVPNANLQGAGTGFTALADNLAAYFHTSVVPRDNTQSPVGGAGTNAANADNPSNALAGITATTATGAPVVTPLQSWQLSNPTLDSVGRLGLPVVGGVLAYKGHRMLGFVLALPAAVLWYSRLKGGI